LSRVLPRYTAFRFASGTHLRQRLPAAPIMAAMRLCVAVWHSGKTKEYGPFLKRAATI
jgi:hypothetical protein